VHRDGARRGGHVSAAGDAAAERTLLFVDDEPNILASLRRLFRNPAYRVFTGEGGRAGLAVLEKERVDLVISDMRMPEMTGAEFLAEVAKRWPGTIRILLTGYADLSSTIDAVNKGAIYRYVSKPWEDNDLRITVQQALEQQHLRRERERLTAVVARQNAELRELNAGLEAKVKARTEEIRQTADMLELAYKELKRSYVEAIPVFASFAELGEGERAGHGRRVADMARALAELVGLGEEDVQNVYFGALLHDIGKLGMPGELLAKPFVAMSTEERAQIMRHPVIGQAAFMALDAMQDAARLIRHHHERFDGKGYPDKLTGEAIPVGARILAVVNEFDALQLGTLVEGQLTMPEARSFLVANRGTRYDPKVVDAFLQWLDVNPDYGRVANDLRLTSDDLRPGMTLARDLVNADGILILSRGRALSDRMIGQIKRFEREENRGFTIFVKRTN
jgi:response regulator RpfG family c-di-GMP phosphodiesterase